MPGWHGRIPERPGAAAGRPVDSAGDDVAAALDDDVATARRELRKVCSSAGGPPDLDRTGCPPVAEPEVLHQALPRDIPRAGAHLPALPPLSPAQGHASADAVAPRAASEHRDLAPLAAAAA